MAQNKIVLFAVNDAGPARYISYIIKHLKKIKYICISSDISSKIFDNFKIKYIKNCNDINLDNIKLIITGTCLNNCLDKKWIKIGKENNIKTISIIEHWSLYKKRFEVNGEYIFPEEIWVNDEIAKNDAIQDGINYNLIRIVGNPVLENIRNIKYSLKEEKEWKKKLKIPNNKKIVTFISEEIAKDFPNNSEYYPGFNEYEVLNDILEGIDNNSFLIIKLHPCENENKYERLKKYKNILILKHIDISKLIYFSNIIIGMNSMLLIEAAFLKNTVFSYRPKEKIEFIGNRLGFTYKITNKFQLKEILTKEIVFYNRNKNFKKRFKQSVKTIIDIIERYMK